MPFVAPYMGELRHLAKAAEIRRLAHVTENSDTLRAALLVVADALESAPDVPPDMIARINLRLAELARSTGVAPALLLLCGLGSLLDLAGELDRATHGLLVARPA